MKLPFRPKTFSDKFLSSNFCTNFHLKTTYKNLLRVSWTMILCFKVFKNLVRSLLQT
jgi:hypothetical protein